MSGLRPMRSESLDAGHVISAATPIESPNNVEAAMVVALRSC